MRQNGAMFICNRCRKQVFAERFDDGRFDQKALDGWALETHVVQIRPEVHLIPDM